MATCTSQLPIFRAHRLGRCKHPQRASDTPLCEQKASKQHQQVQDMESSTRRQSKEVLLFPLFEEKLFAPASASWSVVVQYHRLSSHILGVQYLEVTSNKVREKRINLIIYLPLRSTLTWNVWCATTRAEPCFKANFCQGRAVPTCESSEGPWPSAAFL